MLRLGLRMTDKRIAAVIVDPEQSAKSLLFVREVDDAAYAVV